MLLEGRVIKFILKEEFTDSDFNELLTTLTEIFDRNKSIAIYADTRKAIKIPLSSTIILEKWMKTQKDKIKNNLICSAIIIQNKKISDLFNFVFSIQPPTRPNLITIKDIEIKDFLDKNLKDFEKSKNI